MTVTSKRPRTSWGAADQHAATERTRHLNNLLQNATPLQQRTIKCAFARALIESEHLQLEPKLTESCWIEYAYLTPWDRTELFAQDYLDIYRHMHAKYVDLNASESRMPTSPTLAANRPATISSLWRARQLADEMGMPYRTFLFFMFDASMDEGHKRLPAPNQLYDVVHGVELVDYWCRERQSTKRLDVAAWDPRFLSWNFRGEAPQRRLHEIARTRIGKSSMNLANYMRESMPVLTEAHAREYFGDALTDEALRTTGPISVKNADPLHGYVPPCFGLVSSSTASCETCPLREKCSFMDARVRALMITEFKCSDPRKEHQRKLARERQQRRRAKQREAKLKTAR